MRLTIAAIGKLKAGPELALIDDYLGRARAIGRGFGVSAIDLLEKDAGRALTGLARQTKEAELLRDMTTNAARRVALDETGKTMTSPALATHLKNWIDEGAPEIAFLIGGADGHTDATRASADLVLSFGKLTWPHMLARVMLTEQLYRSLTIMGNHPYHRV